jgi:hypothetical protein
MIECQGSKQQGSLEVVAFGFDIVYYLGLSAWHFVIVWDLGFSA